MVPNLTKGAGIKGTALYVLHDERTLEEKALGHALTPEQQTAHRVGFTATRNLSTDDPELAWRLMCQTAKAQDELKQAAGVRTSGRRTEKFCGHISLSWDHAAQPDRAEMMRAAEGALTSLGWERAQALIVQHRDHDHAHCHIVVNLIDPETGKTFPNAKNDCDKLQAWADAYDKEQGRIVCPNRAARFEAEEREKAQPRREWLPRQQWEAQQQAKREAAHAAQREQRSQRGQIQAEASQQLKASAAELREKARPEWADLYRQQRAEARALDKKERDQQRQLTRAMSDPRQRAALMQQVQPGYQPPGPAPAPAPAPSWARKTQAAAIPAQQLASAVFEAQAKERAALEQRQQLEKAELAAKWEAARHDAQRAIFQQRRERLDALRQQPPPRAPEQAPPSKAEQELQRYAEQRRAAEAVSQARTAARAAEESTRSKDPAQDLAAKKPRQDPEQENERTTPARNAGTATPATPANTNDRAAQFLAEYAARRERERQRERGRGRDRER